MDVYFRRRSKSVDTREKTGVEPQLSGELTDQGECFPVVPTFRVELDGDEAREVERYPMGARIRTVVQSPEGAIWVLEGEDDDSPGRLLQLTPKD